MCFLGMWFVIVNVCIIEFNLYNDFIIGVMVDFWYEYFLKVYVFVGGLLL